MRKSLRMVERSTASYGSVPMAKSAAIACIAASKLLTIILWTSERPARAAVQVQALRLNAQEQHAVPGGGPGICQSAGHKSGRASRVQTVVETAEAASRPVPLQTDMASQRCGLGRPPSWPACPRSSWPRWRRPIGRSSSSRPTSATRTRAGTARGPLSDSPCDAVRPACRFCGHWPCSRGRLVEQLRSRFRSPSVDQQLVALRVFVGWLVVGKVTPSNPASSARGPRHPVRKGKTPVLAAEEAGALLDAVDAINVSTMVGLRDRGPIGLTAYSPSRWAQPSASEWRISMFRAAAPCWP